MSISSLFLMSAVVLTLLYFLLGLSAYSNTLPDEKMRRSRVLLVLDPWWPYYDGIYLVKARRICILGKLLLPVIVGLYVGWVMTRL